MGFTALLVTALAAATSAVPLVNPIQAIQAAGPAAGQVITKCSSPGQIALAYDDGPYQYTQKLADILSNGGAKGTFFVTGTLYGTSLLNSCATTLVLILFVVAKQTMLTKTRLHLQPKNRPPKRLQSRPPNCLPHLDPPTHRLPLRLRPHHRDD
jgi:hypothetical protein